jgi:nitrite reductase/ring-hydroxylating ferredoxin subunit
MEVVMGPESQHRNFVEVCRVEDVWEGEMECFRVSDTNILLLKLAGQFRAYQARCPHQGAALVEGHLDGTALTCSAHHWQFNVLNGEGINPRRAFLERFPTAIADGKVLVGIAASANEGRRPNTGDPCHGSKPHAAERGPMREPRSDDD